jgi:glyoxylase-like metal-dependent hydrolase (beta-lactamase superfamily II)
VIENQQAVLIDTGVHKTARAVQKWFLEHQIPKSWLQAILLTHGHSDHIHGARKLSRWSGAPIFMHAADRTIAAGTYSYRGINRPGGLLELASRVVFDVRPVRMFRSIIDRQILPWCGGIEVVSLPGHTPGHVGYYLVKPQLLFCGDALLCYHGKAAFPLAIFNSDHQQMKKSVLRLLDFDIDWIYPAHHADLPHNLRDDVQRFHHRLTQKSL